MTEAGTHTEESPSAEAHAAAPSLDYCPEEAARLSGAAEATPIYGGQALLEGVMMRGPHFIAAAVRREDGEVVVRREALRRPPAWARLPLIRGAAALWDALRTGIVYLNFAGDVLMQEAQEQDSVELPDEEITYEDLGEVGVRATHQPTGLSVDALIERTRERNRVRAERTIRGKVARARAAEPEAAAASEGEEAPAPAGKPKRMSSGTGLAMGVSLALSFVIAIGVFMMTPHATAYWLVEHALRMPMGEPPMDGGTVSLPPGTNIALNVIEGVIRLSLFLLYILGIAQMRDIRRVFQYHGAEHKVVYAVENRAELTVEGARGFSTLHPRCGTNFIAIAICVAIVLLSFLRADTPLLRFGMRLALLPVIAAIAYELLRLAGKFRDRALVRALILPGILLQKLTTRPPDDDQIEIAVRAMKEVIALEARGGL